MPMPGVSTIGASATKAMMKQPMTEEKMVAKTDSSAGMPASARISGLTMMI